MMQTLSFIQFQDTIKHRNHPICIKHIQFHMVLPVSLTQGNTKINQLLIGNVLKASEFQERVMPITNIFKRGFPSCGKK